MTFQQPQPTPDTQACDLQAQCASFRIDEATQDKDCIAPIPFAVDMGAYEFSGTAAPNPTYLGDLDIDGVVGIVDFLVLLANWGPADTCAIADLDFDGDVGITDFLILLGNWG